MRIGLDMMGGDYAPKEACLGLIDFLEKNADCHLVLLGDKSAIEAGLPGIESMPITIIQTENEIGMHEHPIKAMKEKPTSAMVTGFGLLAHGKIDAFLSAGNTGVMLVGASHVIKTIDGLLRPSIPTPVPQLENNYSLMLDIGINADCKPEYLNQFAMLGSFYAKEILGYENPTVALLNIGEEEGKGNILAQATYPLLKENTKINFIGNIEGRDLLDNKADIIITGGSEAVISAAGVGGFNAMKALSERNDSPETASRPFDKDRDGFVMGEGSGVLVLESLEHALARGAKIYCEIAGGGASADAHHITAPHPEGLGAQNVMKVALKDAGLTPQDIDYINVHGTSTPLGDIAETKAILNVFGDHAYALNISSTKSMTGHCLGAAGALEALACIMAVTKDIIPPTINHFTDDPDLDPKLNFTFTKAQHRTVNAALSNTFGFGGHNASVIVKKYVA